MVSPIAASFTRVISDPAQNIIALGSPQKDPSTRNSPPVTNSAPLTPAELENWGKLVDLVSKEYADPGLSSDKTGDKMMSQSELQRFADFLGKPGAISDDTLKPYGGRKQAEAFVAFFEKHNNWLRYTNLNGRLPSDRAYCITLDEVVKYGTNPPRRTK